MHDYYSWEIPIPEEQLNNGSAYIGNHTTSYHNQGIGLGMLFYFACMCMILNWLCIKCRVQTPSRRAETTSQQLEEPEYDSGSDSEDESTPLRIQIAEVAEVVEPKVESVKLITPPPPPDYESLVQ